MQLGTMQIWCGMEPLKVTTASGTTCSHCGRGHWFAAQSATAMLAPRRLALHFRHTAIDQGTTSHGRAIGGGRSGCTTVRARLKTGAGHHGGISAGVRRTALALLPLEELLQLGSCDPTRSGSRLDAGSAQLNGCSWSRLVANGCRCGNGLHRIRFGVRQFVLLLASVLQTGHHGLGPGSAHTQSGFGVPARRHRCHSYTATRGGTTANSSTRTSHLSGQRGALTMRGLRSTWSTVQMLAPSSCSTGQILNTGLHLVGKLWRDHRQVDQSSCRADHLNHLLVRCGAHILAIDRQQKVSRTESCHIRHSTRIHIVQVLQSRKAFRGTQLH